MRFKYKVFGDEIEIVESSVEGHFVACRYSGPTPSVGDEVMYPAMHKTENDEYPTHKGVVTKIGHNVGFKTIVHGGHVSDTYRVPSHAAQVLCACIRVYVDRVEG